MFIVAISSLSGGQGKTTCSIFLGKYLAQKGIPTLLVDGDPQHSLTTYLGKQIDKKEPSLMEVLKKSIPAEIAICDTSENGLYLIPADKALVEANDFLASTGSSTHILRARLQSLEDFEVVIIDSPPQRSQLAITVMGAGDVVLIPAEAGVKGYLSVIATLELWGSIQEYRASPGEVLGVIPFRDKWVGTNQTTESKNAIANIMEFIGGSDLMFPSIVESEKYKQAINQQKTLSALGFPDLEYPFQVLASKIEALKNSLR